MLPAIYRMANTELFLLAILPVDDRRFHGRYFEAIEGQCHIVGQFLFNVRMKTEFVADMGQVRFRGLYTLYHIERF